MRIPLVLVALSLALVPLLRSQDRNPTPPKSPQDPVAALTAAAATTAQHKALARFAGDWTVRGKIYGDPSAPPTDVKGKSEFKMILDGHFLREKYESQFLGKPFEGLCVTGYDTRKQAYVANWVDTVATGFALSEGPAGADANVLETKGTLTDPATGEVVAFRWVRAWQGDDTFVFTSHESRGGKPEAVTMEMTYKRKAEKAK